MSQSAALLLLGATAAAGVAVGLVLGRTLLKPRLSKDIVKHVVLVKFKDDAAPEKVQAFIDAYRTLPKKIKVMHGFEW